ncbi:MAG: ferredoxin [Corallococcus sp.]|nr:ferredoxin [Bacillota bacterium]MCM1533415.1 ferredoxin [Corallococcus sp.]
MKVKVNDDCIGCGMCINLCPEVFDYNAQGLSQVIGDADCNPLKVEESAEVCPVNAIEITE